MALVKQLATELAFQQMLQQYFTRAKYLHDVQTTEKQNSDYCTKPVKNFRKICVSHSE